MSMRLHCNETIKQEATWADVEAVLPELKEEAYFRLMILPKPEIGPRSLEVQAENGNYLPLMPGTEGTGRSFYNPAAKGGEDVEILGNEYSPVRMTQDYDLIVRMIKEFFHTGNVSTELWNA